MKVSKIQLCLLIWKTCFSVVRGLPRYGDLNMQDFNPDLVGKYHTDAFNILKEKYEKDPIKGRPSELSQVLDDMEVILQGYCSSIYEISRKNSCFQELNNYVNKGQDYYNGLNHEPTKLLFEKDQMKQLENALKHYETKDDALNKISSLRNEINLSAENEQTKGTLMALSIAEESFRLWYEVYADDTHPFRGEKNERRLQIDLCLDIAEIVQADIDGGTDAFQNEASWDQVIFQAVIASVNKFFQGCGTPTESPTIEMTPAPSLSQMPSISAAPSTSPTISSLPSILPSSIPSFSPSTSHMPSLAIPPPSSAPSLSSEEPSTSHSPTVGESTLNRLITCVSIVDEAYETSESFFRNKWQKFRELFPDRPFCLLQPSIFTSSSDEESYPYTDIDVSDAIGVPDVYYQDDNTIFSSVRRDMGNQNQLSDWFEICDLAGLREEGVSRVAFFIDESGSMDRTFVQASFDLFTEKIENEGIEIVGAIYNEDEDWIQPFLTNFGFDGPVITSDDDFSFIDCRKRSFGHQMKYWLKSFGGVDPNPF